MKNILAAAALLLALPAFADDTDGIIPGVLFGPRLSLINVPTPSLGAEIHVAGYLGLSYDYGLIPDITIKPAKVGATNWFAGARVYPFRGSFCFGALYGSRRVKLDVTDDSSGLTASARTTSTYLAPVVGWRANHRGFGMAIDLGWQFVTKHSQELTIPTGYDSGKAHDIQDATNTLSKTGIPVLGLLQLQYLF